METCAVCGCEISKSATPIPAYQREHTIVVVFTSHAGLKWANERETVLDEAEMEKRNYQTEKNEAALVENGWERVYVAEACLTGRGC